MIFFALLLAFLLEQVRPLPRGNAVHEAAVSLARWAGHALDAGSKGYAVLAWLLVVAVPSFVVWVAASVAWTMHPFVALVFHVVVLWFTLGFRQFSHSFTEIQMALARGDITAARAALLAWLRDSREDVAVEAMSVPELCRTAIEEGVVASHRTVYGVLFWYAVLPGPAGATLYRLAGMVRQQWGDRADAFGEVARRAFWLLDWIPARMTAIGFAVVGNFEDALHGWRLRARSWADPQRGVVVESAAGSLGIRLARAAPAGDVADDTARLPEPATLQAAVGLLWRAVVLWMALLLLVSLVSWAS